MNPNRAAVSRGEIVGGHYRLERILAEGGMGIVWAARDLRLQRSVAIKFLGESAMACPTQRERFAREAQLASKIRSPHVVQMISDGVTTFGVPFVVMELLDGESLASFLAREERCSLSTCGSIVEQVCRALSSAHSVGLVHRDIKPANIFLTPQPDGDVFVRLLDFGIAKELHFGPAGLTRAGEILGTTSYMSPEQFRKPEAVSAATDIWALGVVVYEMLTGHTPFDDRSFPDLVVHAAHGAFPNPSDVCPSLPSAIDPAVMRAIAVHPSQRYASIDEFGATFLRVVRAHVSKSVIRSDVMLALHDQAAEAHADSAPQRAVDKPTISVRGWPQIWGAVLVAACGLVLVGSWWVLERSERAFMRSEAQLEPAPMLEVPRSQPVVQAQALPVPPPVVEAPAQAAEVVPEPSLEPLPSPSLSIEVPTQLDVAATETSVSAATEPSIVPAPVVPRARRKRSEMKIPELPVHSQAPVPDVTESKYGF